MAYISKPLSDEFVENIRRLQGAEDDRVVHIVSADERPGIS